jgi:hypothetical protein
VSEQPKDESVRVRKESVDKTERGPTSDKVMNTLTYKEEQQERKSAPLLAETDEERQVRELIELKLGKFKGDFETEQLGKVDQQLDELIEKNTKGKKKK